MADNDTPPDTGLDQRVSSLESGQQSILSKLDQLLGAGPQPAAEPERHEVSIADEIRRQLDERDRRKPKTEPAPKAAPEPEQAPKPPVRRVTKLMWGDGD
jgi:hypothetical protein